MTLWIVSLDQVVTQKVDRRTNSSVWSDNFNKKMAICAGPTYEFRSSDEHRTACSSCAMCSICPAG